MMEPLAPARELPAYAEAAEAGVESSESGEGIGLGTLLVLLSPLALAAWLAIGSAVYRSVT